MSITVGEVISQNEKSCDILRVDVLSGRVQIITSNDLPFMRIGDRLLISEPISSGGTTEPSDNKTVFTKID